MQRTAHRFAGGAGVLAFDAEDDEQDHDEVDDRADAQRPFDADDVRGDLGLAGGQLRGGDRIHRQDHDRRTDRAGDLPHRVRHGGAC